MEDSVNDRSPIVTFFEGCVRRSGSRKYRTPLTVGVIWLMISAVLVASHGLWQHQTPWMAAGFALIFLGLSKITKVSSRMRGLFGFCSLMLAVLAIFAFYHLTA